MNSFVGNAQSRLIRTCLASILVVPLMILATNSNSFAFKVAVDPMYGGEDPGPIDQGSKITLEIALKLSKILESKGYETLLTRTSDIGLSAEQIVELSSSNRADVLIGIGLTISHNKNRIGAEVNYYNPYTKEKIETRKKKPEKKDDIGFIFSELHTNLKYEESLKLAARLSSMIKKELGIESELIPKDLSVLIESSMPSAIVYMNAINNNKEDKWLNDSKCRDRIAQTIANAIEEYVKSIGRKRN